MFFFRVLVVAGLLLMTSHVEASETGSTATKSGVSISRATLPADGTCVALTITNHASGVDHLTKVSSPIAKTAVVVDQKRHRDVKVLELPAGEAIEIAKGDTCIILRGFTKNLSAGDSFDLTLGFSNSKAQTVKVAVTEAETPVQPASEKAVSDHKVTVSKKEELKEEPKTESKIEPQEQFKAESKVEEGSKEKTQTDESTKNEIPQLEDAKTDNSGESQPAE